MEPELLLGRGYTGHEHLTMFGLVNMNARLYDPAVGRFLSPDPYVQVPDFTQSYNRFSYAMNNPLMYVDADGENPLLVLGLVIGAFIGGVATNRGELNPFRWNYSSITTYLGLGFGALVGYYYNPQNQKSRFQKRKIKKNGKRFVDSLYSLIDLKTI